MPTDGTLDTKKLRELLAKMTPGPWSVEIEEEERHEGTIVIPEIHRVLHDSKWADKRDWNRDERHAEGIVALVNAAPALLDAAEERDRLRGLLAFFVDPTGCACFRCEVCQRLYRGQRPHDARCEMTRAALTPKEPTND